MTGQPATGVRSLIGSGTPRNGALLAGREATVGVGGGGARVLVVAPDHRVQLRVARVDGGDASVEQLGGRELACGAAPRRARVAGVKGSSEAIGAATLPG